MQNNVKHIKQLLKYDYDPNVDDVDPPKPKKPVKKAAKKNVFRLKKMESVTSATSESEEEEEEEEPKEEAKKLKGKLIETFAFSAPSGKNLGRSGSFARFGQGRII